MTEAEMRLMGEMVKSSMTEALKPLSEKVDALSSDLQGVKSKVSALDAGARNTKLEIQKLKDTDRKHSGAYRHVKEEVLPRMQSKTEEQLAEEAALRERDLEATAGAYERMLLLHEDLSSRLEISEKSLEDIKKAADDAAKAAKTAAENQALSLVQVPDGKGGTEVKAASVLAAQSSVKTEGAISALAVDASNTKDDTTSIKRWTKFVAAASLFVPVIAEILRALFIHGK